MAYQLMINQAGEPGYSGKAEKCTYEFSTMPEQIPGEQWLASQFINRHTAELASQNSRLLHLRVWRDTAPTWQTKYRVEITASASPLWWSAIILGVLAIIAMVLTWRIISTVKDIDWSDIPPTISWGMPIIAGIIVIAVLLGSRRKRHGI